MNTQEIYKAFEDREEIYFLKRYFNGDILPTVGRIIAISSLTPFEIENVDLVDLEMGEKIENVNSEFLFKKDELPNSRKYILTLELEKLTKEIKIKEKELKHLKRKYERYKKQYEEESRKLENE